MKKLQEAIKLAAQTAFQAVRLAHPNDHFCGYALYSDTEALTVCPSVNSVEDVEKMVRSDPTDAQYYRWRPAEWRYEFEGVEHFSSVATLLSELAANTHDAFRERLRDMVYEACVVVLEQMRAEGFFADLNHPGVLVFAVSDSLQKSEPDWIDRLNSVDSATQFRGWYEAVVRLSVTD